MMSLVKDKTITPTNPTNSTSKEKKKKREERQKKFLNAPVCKHCGKKHPSKAEDAYRELDKNAASRPAAWKSTKSTCRCAGSQVETEVWQPGKVLLNKINNAHLTATNYWTPLQSDKTEADDKTEEANNINNKPIPKSNKWERRLARRIEKRMIIDSGAASHFCSEEMDLPKEEESNKSVYLPNGDIIQMTKRTSLPFQQLSKRAREAHVLPHLRQSLMSINKLSEEGYTTIFHPQFMKKEHLQSLQAIHRCSKGAKKRETTYGQCQQMKKKARKKQTMYTTYHRQNKAYVIYMQQQDSQLKANG